VGDGPAVADVAVMITGFPAQTGFDEGAMDTLTGMDKFTVIVMALDMAGFPDGQLTFEVS